jgi:hypothetical protein
VAGRGLPASHYHPGDERLVVWILGTVARALASSPLHLFDAPINHPAPGQLAAIEHLLAWQALFAPLFAATGDALLSANAVALLSYPLAALAMCALLVARGCGLPTAWVVGLLFALGSERVPGSLMVLKLANLGLPLVALALDRLRARPTAAGTAALALALAASALCSYYAAVIVAVGTIVWTCFALADPRPDRGRFVVAAAAGGGVALAVLIVVSLPYLARADAHGTIPEPAEWVVTAKATQQWKLPLALAAAAAVGAALVAARAPDVGALARRGLCLTLLAQLLMLGARWSDGPWAPWPFRLIAVSPLRFFRYAWYFEVLFGFGAALLVAAALEGARRVGRPLGWAAAAAIGVAIAVGRGPLLARGPVDEIAGARLPVYDLVATATRGRADGALLELPSTPPSVRGSVGTETDAMIGSLRHGLPLVHGYTAYPPPHRKVVDQLILRLPDPQALRDLQDLTHLRWLLLRPVTEWSGWFSREMRAALLASPSLERVAAVDGWDLLRLTREPERPGWYRQIAAGAHPGETILGTPLRPIPDPLARATVVATLPPVVIAGQPFGLDAQVTNTGMTWPVASPRPDADLPTVALVARWTLLDGAGVAHEEMIPFVRDVTEAEAITMRVTLRAPPVPGEYRLDVRPRQRHGAQFEGHGNVALTRRVLVQALPAPAP